MGPPQRLSEIGATHLNDSWHLRAQCVGPRRDSNCSLWISGGIGRRLARIIVRKQRWQGSILRSGAQKISIEQHNTTELSTIKRKIPAEEADGHRPISKILGVPNHQPATRKPVLAKVIVYRLRHRTSSPGGYSIESVRNRVAFLCGWCPMQLPASWHAAPMRTATLPIRVSAFRPNCAMIDRLEPGSPWPWLVR